MRVRVWKEVAVGTLRIVKLRLNKDSGMRGKGWSSSTKHPALLHTCREARYEGLKTYELRFHLEQNGATISPPRIYFNAQLDTLYLDKNAVESSRGHWHPDRQALASIQHLAVQTDVWTMSEDNGNRVHGNPFTLEALTRFRQLKTLTLVRDFTTMKEHKREEAKKPLRLRQRMTDENKLLKKVVEKLDQIKQSDIEKFNRILTQHLTAAAMLPDSAIRPSAPVLEYTPTPAIRLMEYQAGGPDYKNGAQRYSDTGEWKGYGRGSLVRLARGWQWIIAEQLKDEEDQVSEKQKFSMEVAGLWKY